MLLDYVPVALVGAVIGGVFSWGGIFIKQWYDSRDKRVDHRKADEATLAQSEREFRLTYLKELQQCKDNLKAMSSELAEKTRQSIERDEKLRRLQWEMKQLCREVKKRIPDFDDSMFTATEEGR